MKTGIHPKWNHQAEVKCACGATFLTGSQQDHIEVDICSQCHPFFTGEMKFVDVQGRVDKFFARQQAAQTRQATSKKKGKKQDDAEDGPAKSLKDLLQEEKKRLQAEAKAN